MATNLKCKIGIINLNVNNLFIFIKLVEAGYKVTVIDNKLKIIVMIFY